MKRLALSAQPGDAGGPVLDAAGGVLGVLLPREDGTGRSLPPEVHFAANGAAMADFLGQNGIALAAAPSADTMLAPEDIALVGADMTVLITCWN